MRPYRDRQRTLEQLLRHLDVWAEELSAWEIVRRDPITDWTVTAPDGAARPIETGGAWDNRIGIHKFSTAKPFARQCCNFKDLRCQAYVARIAYCNVADFEICLPHCRGAQQDDQIRRSPPKWEV